MHERLMPIFNRGQLTVGPILNGFLPDNANGTATFNSFPRPRQTPWTHSGSTSTRTPTTPARTPINPLPCW